MTAPGWAPPERVFHERARAELQAGIGGEEFALGPLTIRASVLPLFRRAIDGGLEVAIRLVVRGGADDASARFRLEMEGRVCDSATLNLNRNSQSIRLFMPDIDRPTHVTISVGAGELPSSSHRLMVRPTRKWQLYLIQQSHLDIGYTDPQSLVARHHLHFLDSVLDFVGTTDSWPDEARFRWNVEATWPLRRWLAARPPLARTAFMQRVREGRIGIDAMNFNLHTEACSIDELARQLRFAVELREEEQIEITTATQTDVPGSSQALVGLLADAGIKFLSVAHNFAGRAVPYLLDGQHLERPFRWRAASDREVLVWYTDSAHGLYSEGNVVGLAEGYGATLELLPEYLAALAERPYPYREILQAMTWPGLPPGMVPTRRPYPHDILHLRVQGVIADNAPPNLTPAEVVRRWNQEWVFPRLRLATNAEFFAAAQAKLGGDIPEFTGDWTDWWADGLGSAAREVGLNRRAQSTLPTAQTVDQLAAVLETREVSAESPSIEAAYESLALFDEHTWGAAEPWGDGLERRDSGALQWRTKAGFAIDAYERSEDLLEAATHRMAALLASPRGDSVAVFNPSSTFRTDRVDVFVPESRLPAGIALELRDEATGDLVSFARRPQEHERHRPRGIRLTFVAKAVPPLGYARYLITTTGPAPADDPGDSPAGLRLENDHYLAEVDAASGCVKRLLDRELGIDLVDRTQAVGFNQYVHDRYSVAANFGYLSSRISGSGDWLLGSRLTAGEGQLISRVRNSVYDELTVRLAADGCSRLETTYRLIHGVRRLEIENRLFKVASAAKESTYFAFAFGLSQPRLRYETTGGIDGPDLPRVPGSATHMRAIRHWVSLQGQDATFAWATMEAPLVEFGNIHLPYAPFPESIAPAHCAPASVFSWVTNNIWDTNFPGQQGGEMLFRYAVTSGPPQSSAAEVGSLAASGMTRPLLPILCPPSPRGDMPARASFCEVDGAGVDVVGIGPSRRGRDLTIHLRSLAEREIDIGLKFPRLPIRRVEAGTFMEERMEPVVLSAGLYRTRLQPGEFRAISVELAR